MHIENTSRLKLSLMTLNDSALLFELDQDERVMHFLNGGVKTSQHQIDTVMIPRLAQYLSAVVRRHCYRLYNISVYSLVYEPALNLQMILKSQWKQTQELWNMRHLLII